MSHFKTSELRDTSQELQELRKQLAASQAREQQLRRLSDAGFKAIAAISGGVISDLSVQSIRNIEQIGSDTTAIEAMITKAGEVMRGRVLAIPFHMARTGKEIRALPGVTLEDLKGGGA